MICQDGWTYLIEKDIDIVCDNNVTKANKIINYLKRSNFSNLTKQDLVCEMKTYYPKVFGKDGI